MKRIFPVVMTAIAILFSPMPLAFAADTSAPLLVDWTLQNSNADISTSSRTVSVKFILSDDSKINEPKLLVKSLETTQMSSFAIVKEVAKSGKLVSYEAIATINLGQAPREWEWVLYPLTDEFGNTNNSFGPGGSWKSRIVVYDSVFTIANAREVQKCLVYIGVFNSRISKYLSMKSKDPTNESLAVLKFKYNFPDSIINSDLCSSDTARILKLANTDPIINQELDRVAEEIDAKEAKSISPKKTTITCVKGKLVKKVTGVKPKCPSGYKVKK
jgi:hypothetical protein